MSDLQLIATCVVVFVVAFVVTRTLTSQRDK